MTKKKQDRLDFNPLVGIPKVLQTFCLFQVTIEVNILQSFIFIMSVFASLYLTCLK